MERTEAGPEIQKDGNAEFDDDGKPKRTGNMWTVSAHIITAIIGSGVLSLAWGMAQLGWIVGVLTLIIFSFITLYTSNLLADCYRSPITGKRNYTYTDLVKNSLGDNMYKACATVRYANLAGCAVGYTITAAISMAAIKKANCFHKFGHLVSCRRVSYSPYIIGMGVIELFVSQIPNFHKLSMLSIVAAVMSFAYSSIGLGLSLAKLISGALGLGLSLAKLISGPDGKTTLTGVEIGNGLSAADKTWKVFSAFGCICFAYTYSQILVEIQDTLKETAPENQVMKKANVISILITTIFYMMCACFGYAAFGNNAPGNFLTGFGFYEPYWLVGFANACIVLHLVGAYQVYIQPIYSAVETWAATKWPNSKLVTNEYAITIGKNKRCIFRVNFFRLIWRSTFVSLSTFVALIVPIFNDVLALIGAISYWPLTVYFPVQMYIANKKIERWTRKWLGLQLINTLCVLVALAAACGSIQGLTKTLTTYKPFQIKD